MLIDLEERRRRVMAKADALSTYGMSFPGFVVGAGDRWHGGTREGLAELDRMIEFFSRAMTERLNWSPSDAVDLYVYCQKRRAFGYGEPLIVAVGGIH